MENVILLLLFMLLLYGIPELLRQMKKKTPPRPVIIPKLPPETQIDFADSKARPEVPNAGFLQDETVFSPPVTLSQPSPRKPCQPHFKQVQQGVLWAELLSPPLALRRRRTIKSYPQRGGA